jgi:hypothetical protein
MRRYWKLLLGLAVALALSIPAALPIAAYRGEIPTNVQVTVRGRVHCPGTTQLRARVLGPSGTPVPRARLVWTITATPDPTDRLTHAQTRTNSQGISNNGFHVGRARRNGDRTIFVQAYAENGTPGGNDTVTIHVTSCRRGGQEEGAGGAAATPPFTGLPGTDMASGESLPSEWYLILAALTLIVATIGFIPRIRRRRLTP